MKNHIAKQIKIIYDFHDYEVPKERVLAIAQILINIKEPKSKQSIEDFFYDILSGKYGILYKAPTCLTSMYWKEFRYTDPYLP